MLKFVSNLFILGGVVLLLLAYGPIVKDEVWYLLKEWRGQEYVLSTDDGGKPSKVQNESIFGKFISGGRINIVPVNKDFAIVIEKIGVNAPVKADVSVTNADNYNEALKSGVAHASTSDYPSSDPGNVYLFAHASVNFWELGKYATVFNLLRKVNVGDKIHVFYRQSNYLYEVVNSEIVSGWNIYSLKRTVIEPILTLQTCDPPGTTINRLVVTAKLINVLEV